MVIEAKYEDGVFKPLGKVKIEEGTVVEIHLDSKRTARTVKSIRDLGLPECGPTVRISKMA